MPADGKNQLARFQVRKPADVEPANQPAAAAVLKRFPQAEKSFAERVTEPSGPHLLPLWPGKLVQKVGAVEQFSPPPNGRVLKRLKGSALRGCLFSHGSLREKPEVIADRVAAAIATSDQTCCGPVKAD